LVIVKFVFPLFFFGYSVVYLVKSFVSGCHSIRLYELSTTVPLTISGTDSGPSYIIPKSTLLLPMVFQYFSTYNAVHYGRKKKRGNTNLNITDILLFSSVSPQNIATLNIAP